MQPFKMKRQVWVPVKTMVLVEFETNATGKQKIFEQAVDIAYESDLRTLHKDDYMLDDDEIQNPTNDLLDQWVED